MTAIATARHGLAVDRAGAPSDGVLVLETDLAGELAIWQGRGGVDQTAYALLSDLPALPRGGRRLVRR